MADDRVLLVVAPYYEDIAAQLEQGAMRALAAVGLPWDRIGVPGAFEIPGAIAAAAKTGRYVGYVALGCVIRGETSHYDIVAGESARGLVDLAVQRGALIGNGILTTDTGAQARVRAAPDGKDKGGAAARAALALLQLKARLRS